MSATLPPDLKRVQRTLQHHRRQSGRQRIPDTIRQQTVSLLSVYPRKQVINALGISYKMLCSWERACTQGPVIAGECSASASPGFIRLPVAAEAPSAARDLSAIELYFGNEVRLAFHGASAPAQCQQLLQGLGYGRASASVSQVVSV